MKSLFNKMDTIEFEAKKNKTVSVKTIGNRTFKRMWLVADMGNGFKTVKDGFETKAEALDYCNTVSFKWYLTPYEIEL